MPRLKFVVAGGLILGAITYLMFSGISDSMVYYYTVSEALELAQEDAGKGIRISGYVSSGTIEREESESRVGFLVYDRDGAHTLPVVYQGIIPDTFKDDAEVVVEEVMSEETRPAATDDQSVDGEDSTAENGEQDEDDA